MEDVGFQYITFLHNFILETQTIAITLDFKATPHGTDVVLMTAEKTQVFSTPQLVGATEALLRPLHAQYVGLCRLAQCDDPIAAQREHFSQFFSVVESRCFSSSDVLVDITLHFASQPTPLQLLVFEDRFPVVSASQLQNVADVLARCDMAPYHNSRGCLKTYTALPCIGGFVVDLHSATNDHLATAVNAAFQQLRGTKPDGLLARKITDSLLELIRDAEDPSLALRCTDLVGPDDFPNELLCLVQSAIFNSAPST